MALTKDLYDLTVTSSELRNRVTQSALIVATEIVLEAPATENHANRLVWAIDVIKNPESWGMILLRFLIAQYWQASVADILIVPDTVEGEPGQGLLAAVRNVANTFANNFAGG